MRIAIYGDSFGKSMIENIISDNINRGKAWTELLEEKYKVTNFSYPGSSLFYSYKLFLENNQNFDYNIFLVTEPNRITLPDDINLNNDYNGPSLTKHINLSLVDSYNKFPSINNQTQIISALTLYYSFIHNQDSIDIFHNLMVENITRVNQKTIVIPCFKSSIPNTKVSLDSISNYEFSNCKIFKLLRAHDYHYWTPIENKWAHQDYRKCHFNEENNKILYTIIEDAINNKQQTINLNLNQFVTASKDIEYYHIYTDLTIEYMYNNPRRLNGELHNLYNKLLIDTN